MAYKNPSERNNLVVDVAKETQKAINQRMNERDGFVADAKMSPLLSPERATHERAFAKRAAHAA